jgi:hypothetical protein
VLIILEKIWLARIPDFDQKYDFYLKIRIWDNLTIWSHSLEELSHWGSACSDNRNLEMLLLSRIHHSISAALKLCILNTVLCIFFPFWHTVIVIQLENAL